MSHYYELNGYASIEDFNRVRFIELAETDRLRDARKLAAESLKNREVAIVKVQREDREVIEIYTLNAAGEVVPYE